MKIALVTVARSGSTWLCEMMSKAGGGFWGELWWSDTPYDWVVGEFLQKEMEHETACVKVFQEVLIRNIQFMLDYDWKYIRLQRDDKLGQAFSSYRAFESKEWHKIPPEVAFNRDEIWNRYRYLISSEIMLDSILDRLLNPKDVYFLRYEDLRASPEMEVRALADWLEIGIGDIDPTVMEIYRDEEINEAWKNQLTAADLRQFGQMYQFWKTQPRSMDLDYWTRLDSLHGAQDGMHVADQSAG